MLQRLHLHGDAVVRGGRPLLQIESYQEKNEGIREGMKERICIEGRQSEWWREACRRDHVCPEGLAPARVVRGRGHRGGRGGGHHGGDEPASRDTMAVILDL